MRSFAINFVLFSAVVRGATNCGPIASLTPCVAAIDCQYDGTVCSSINSGVVTPGNAVHNEWAHCAGVDNSICGKTDGAINCHQCRIANSEKCIPAAYAAGSNTLTCSSRVDPCFLQPFECKQNVACKYAELPGGPLSGMCMKYDAPVSYTATQIVESNLYTTCQALTIDACYPHKDCSVCAGIEDPNINQYNGCVPKQLAELINFGENLGKCTHEKPSTTTSTTLAPITVPTATTSFAVPTFLSGFAVIAAALLFAL